MAGTACSISSVTAGTAAPPYAGFTLKPFHRAGLWLAVIMMPEPAPRSITAKESAGVGSGASERATRIPFPAITSAAAAAKESERNRVS